MNQTETNMLNAHIAECVRYGVTPLSEDVLATMEAMGYGLDDAFSVASDLDCGFSWKEALAALEDEEWDGQPDEAQEWHDFDPEC